MNFCKRAPGLHKSSGRPVAPLADRSAKILAAIDPAMRILEIGPSFSPIAAKADGWQTRTVDHATKDDLIEKYCSDPNVADLSRIEDVDVIWTRGPLDAAVPRDLWGTFDACIASHVLEHMPDPRGFYQMWQTLLDLGHGRGWGASGTGSYAEMGVETAGDARTKPWSARSTDASSAIPQRRWHRRG